MVSCQRRRGGRADPWLPYSFASECTYQALKGPERQNLSQNSHCARVIVIRECQGCQSVSVRYLLAHGMMYNVVSRLGQHSPRSDSDHASVSGSHALSRGAKFPTNISLLQLRSRCGTSNGGDLVIQKTMYTSSGQPSLSFSHVAAERAPGGREEFFFLKTKGGEEEEGGEAAATYEVKKSA